MNNTFDYTIIHAMNAFSNVSPEFDELVIKLSSLSLLKGGVFMAAVWFFWFANADEQERSRTREELLANLFASFIGVILCRIIALMLPFRERPLRNPELHFVLPYSLDPSTLIGWSSFPSDHAAMFFSFATGLYFLSRTTGLIAFLYVPIVICLPRIYLGFHYPSDIIGGALLGIGLGWLIHHADKVRRSISVPLIHFMNKNGSVFYATMFILMYEVSRTFEDVLYVGGHLGKALLHMAAR